MGQTDTLVLWRERLIEKLRQRDVAEADLDRRADEMMAPLRRARVKIQTRDEKVRRRLHLRGWSDDDIEQALIELAFRRSDRFVRNASRQRAEGRDGE
ncbi:hypothetical protein [Microvirga massiliensis]|uniref:hypothetical protein n=1 Tax=Microvirga massiliensis TaxID=1033741 RepID=UPI00062B8F0B|nr:hypothetical protein [Microvirga massiliensis]